MKSRFTLGAVVVGVPLVPTLLGPLSAGDPVPRAASFTPGGEHWPGTDFAGRDVWRQVLPGGRSVVLVALAATAPAHLVAPPAGLISALTHRTWLEELLMRPLDVLLAVPSLLMTLLVAASVFPPGGTAGLLRDRADLALVLITHDLDTAAVATGIAVLDAGDLVDQGPAPEVPTRPRHPFTVSLMGTSARLTAGARP